MTLQKILLMLLLACNESPLPPPIPSSFPTPDELVAGYQQNIALFECLHVRWDRREQKTDAWKLALEKQAQTLTALSEKANSEDGRRSFLKQAEQIRSVANEQKNFSPRHYAQDSWFTPHGFQVRFRRDSDILGDNLTLPRITEVEPKHLQTDFKDIAIIIHNADEPSRYEIWDGLDRRSVASASIQADFPVSRLTQLPPFAAAFITPSDARTRILHPIDAFFQMYATQSVESSVLGSSILANRKVWVMVSRVERMEIGSFLPKDKLAKYKDRIRMFDCVWGWISPELGYLPLKLAWGSEFWLDGKPQPGGNPLSVEFRTSRMLEDIEVVNVEKGGFYPISCKLKEYCLDPMFTGKVNTITDVIEGVVGPNMPTVVSSEVVWNIESVTVDCMPRSSLALTVPNNTMLIDHVNREKKLFGDELVKKFERAEEPLPLPAATERGSKWLKLFLVSLPVLAAMVVLVLFFRRVK